MTAANRAYYAMFHAMRAVMALDGEDFRRALGRHREQVQDDWIRARLRDYAKAGVGYLRIEGAFYPGIGMLFLLYGYFRGMQKPMTSVVLTVISLGTRVALAYLLSAIPAIGVVGIWWSVPIGWFLADMTGLLYFKIRKNKLLPLEKV